MITGSQGECVGSLKVNDHTGSDIDFIGGEYANFVWVIGSSECVGFVDQGAGHKRTVTVQDGTKSCIDGKRSAGEDQFGHLRAKDFD